MRTAVISDKVNNVDERVNGTAHRRRPDWMLIAPAAVTMATMLWGITGAPYWRDEADTLSAAYRSVPQLFRLLGRVDAVHGLYYLMMWPVVKFAGLSEFATRLPSAIAMAAAALGIAAIGRRIRSRRAGLYAGLVFAATPMVSFQGQDARPYAAEAAAAVLASYLLLRVADRPTPRRLAWYGLSLVLLGYMHLFGLLIIPAHALALIPAARLARARRAGAGSDSGSSTGRADDPARPGNDPAPQADDGVRLADDGTLIRRWLATVTVACALTVPVIWLGWHQRNQISWLPKPHWTAVPVLAIALAGSAASVWLIAALILVGIARADWPDRFPLRWPGGGGPPAGDPRAGDPGAGDPRAWTVPRQRLAAWAGRPDHVLTSLAVPWLVLPPAILLTASLFAHVYSIAYTTFCLPAAALLAGAGLAAMARPLRYAALAGVVVLSLPTQQLIRGPNARGDNFGQAAQLLIKNQRPGDAVYYPRGVPTWYLCYPRGFGTLRDFALAQTPAQAGRLIGIEAPLPVLQQRLHSVHRLWIIELKNRWQKLPLHLGPGFKLAHRWRVASLLIRLYIRSP